MADEATVSKGDAAEKAYAAAAESVPVKTSDLSEAPPVQFPPKAKRDAKPPVAEPVATKPTPPAKPVEVKKVAAKVAKPARPAAKKTTPVKTVTTKPTVSQFKDKIMATKTKEFAEGISGIFSDVKGKAKAAFEKGTSAIGDANDFAKGNVEAAVESSKILAAGLQDLGSSYVAETRSAFETLTADVKELAAAKTPTDFFKLQSEFARRNFDSAIALGSKNSEALFKLANEAFAPISGRVNLAVDKLKKAA